MDAHPMLMLESWLKEAMEAQRPAGVGNTRQRVGKERQEYAQPNPPAAATTDTVSSQKALSPPPVL